MIEQSLFSDIKCTEIPNVEDSGINKTKEIFQAQTLPTVPMTTSEKLRIAGLTICFPIGLGYLAWRGTAWVAAKLAFAAFGLKNKLMQSIKLHHVDTMGDKLETFYKETNANPHASLIQAKTYDDCLLRGAIAWNDKEDKKTFESWDGTGDPPKLKNQKFVLFLNGNYTTYQISLPNHLKTAQDLGANVLSFNNREVTDSGGVLNNAHELLVDGHTMISYLRDYLKVPSENIIILARSVNGGTGAKLALLDDIKLVINERSYSSISGFYPGKLEKKIIEQDVESLTRRNGARWTAAFVRFWVQQLLSAVNWDIDTLDSFLKLREKNVKIIVTSGGEDALMQAGGMAYKGLKRALEGYVKIDPLLSKECKQLENNDAIKKKYETPEFKPVYEQYIKNETLKKTITHFKFKKLGHSDDLSLDPVMYEQYTQAIKAHFSKT